MTQIKLSCIKKIKLKSSPLRAQLYLKHCSNILVYIMNKKYFEISLLTRDMLYISPGRFDPPSEKSISMHVCMHVLGTWGMIV